MREIQNKRPDYKYSKNFVYNHKDFLNHVSLLFFFHQISVLFATEYTQNGDTFISASTLFSNNVIFHMKKYLRQRKISPPPHPPPSHIHTYTLKCTSHCSNFMSNESVERSLTSFRFGLSPSQQATLLDFRSLVQRHSCKIRCGIGVAFFCYEGSLDVHATRGGMLLAESSPFRLARHPHY